MALLSGALLVFAQLQTDSSYVSLLPGMLLGGVGMAITMTPMTAAALSSVPVDKAGVGSGMLNTFRQVGGSLGIAVMGAIVASGISTALANGDPQPIAYLHGFHDALRVGSLLCLAGAVVAVLAIRKVEHREHAPEAAVEAA